MNEQEIRYLGDVQRLTLSPGDIVVLKVKDRITQEMAKGIKDRLCDMLPANQIIVLDSGADIGVLGLPS